MPAIDPNAFEDITIPDMPIMSPMAFAYPPAAQGTDSSQLIMALISARHAERVETAPQNSQYEEQPNSGANVGEGAAGLAVSEAPPFPETPATDTPAAASSEPEQPKTQPEPQPKSQPEAPAPQPAAEPAPAAAAPELPPTAG